MANTLFPSAKLYNLKVSFDAYIAEQLGNVFIPANASGIDYVGLGFGPQQDSLKEWIAPAILGPAHPRGGIARDVAPGVRGANIVPILQVNIFSRPSRQTNAHRLMQLRDLIADVLSEGARIPVRDYADDKATIGYLLLDDISMDQEIPTLESDQDLQQWTYSINARWYVEYRSA